MHISKMVQAFTYLLFIVALPIACLAQEARPGSKKIMVGGWRLDADDCGMTFGSNPIFLVPMDITGNVSFTGIINNVRVRGKFAPYAYITDTIMVEDPVVGDISMVIDSFCKSRKQGEWAYYPDGPSYYEYYEKGELVKRDSFQHIFHSGNREITLADSMARIRSIIDLYIKKGDGSRY